MKEVIYWIGLAHVAGYTVFGAGVLAEKLIDRTIKSTGLYREFMAFVYERLKRKYPRHPA